MSYEPDSGLQTDSRDHSLPSWGPYSRHYGGAAWIAGGHGQPLLEVIPVIARERGGAIIPDANVESGYHPWRAAPFLDSFSFRYEIAWKDLEYADVAFFQAEGGLVAEIDFVNNSSVDRSYVSTFFAHLRVAPHTVIDETSRANGGTFCWIGAENYQSLVLPSNLDLRHPSDGLRPGLTQAPGFVGMIGLGNILGKDLRSRRIFGASNTQFLMMSGTTVEYTVPAEAHGCDQLVLRYSMAGLAQLDVEIEIDGHTTACSLGAVDAADETPQVFLVQLAHPIQSGTIYLRVNTVHPSVGTERHAFALDGLCLTTEQTPATVAELFRVYDGSNRFEVLRSPDYKGVIFSSNEYPNLQLAMFSDRERPVAPFPYDDATVTHVYHHELDGVEIRRKLSNDALTNWWSENCRFADSGKGHFAGYNLGPIICKAGTRQRVVVTLVASRDPEENGSTLLERCTNSIHSAPETEAENDEWFMSGYSFSQERMKAQLFTNLVYPCRIGSEHVRAYTPGKRFGTIFTWDSGMHGIGITQYEPRLAFELVHQYLANPEDESDAVLHGPPQPIHMYLLHELLIRTGRTEFIESHYSRLKRYFEYFSGLSKRSSYARSNTGILTTHHETYGSAGIDDYPAKHYVEQNFGCDSYAPAITSAHAIRCARLMGVFASLTGNEADIPLYESVGDRLSQLLQRYSWDESSGYFSFTRLADGEKLYYDDDKKINFNMGLDGVAPLFAGVCTDAQARRVVNALLSPEKMWSPAGITTVDRSAPYFRPDGYWVGKVWMPHQWLLFKGMLDYRFPDAAEKVAMTALETWRLATDETYNCYELFDAQTRMGGGCHQFAGLSGPVASFYASFFRKGAVTVGFNSFVRDIVYDPDQPSLSFTFFTTISTNETLVLVVLGQSGTYDVSIDHELSVIDVLSHHAWVRIPAAQSGIRVQLQRKQVV